MIGLVRGPTGKNYWEATNRTPAFTDWGEGQPSADLSCTQFWGGVDYAWDDFPCTSPKMYLCERQTTEDFY